MVGTGAVLDLVGQSPFDGHITGFGASGSVHLSGRLAQSAVVVGHTLELFSGPAGTGDMVFSFSDITGPTGMPLNAAGLLVTLDSVGEGTIIACFVAGTRILTEHGEIAIEHLAIGDRVLTRGNGARPIKWIGKRSYNSRIAASNPHLQPVRIKAGMLETGMPARDLLVSPGHALYFDTSAAGGVLVEARLLTNGVTIMQSPPTAELHYLHLELGSHDVIFAERTPVETFVDIDCRAMFANAADYAVLYPDEPNDDRRYVFPRVEHGLALAEIRARLAIRAGIKPDLPPGPLRGCIDRVADGAIEGWVQDVINPDQPVMFELYGDGRILARDVANRHRPDLEAAGIGDGRLGYQVPLPPGFEAARAMLRRMDDHEPLPGDMPPTTPARHTARFS